MLKVEALFRALRPANWIKNGFLFIPLIFSGRLLLIEYLFQEILAFIVFCLASSSVYLINDVLDFHSDKLHPLKSKRPIASGLISIHLALGTSLLLLFTSFYLSSIVNKSLILILLIYYLLNLLYSFALKKVVLIDVIIIAMFYEIRIWTGAVVIGVIPSVWIQMMMFLLALFIGLAKRRHEVYLLGEAAQSHRLVLTEYPVQLLDQLMGICAAPSMVAYALYAVSPSVLGRKGGVYLIYTLPFVIYGIFRYFYLVQVKKMGGDPVKLLLVDGSLLISVLLWVGLVFIILYI